MNAQGSRLLRGSNCSVRSWELKFGSITCKHDIIGARDSYFGSLDGRGQWPSASDSEHIDKRYTQRCQIKKWKAWSINIFFVCTVWGPQLPVTLALPNSQLPITTRGGTGAISRDNREQLTAIRSQKSEIWGSKYLQFSHSQRWRPTLVKSSQ